VRPPRDLPAQYEARLDAALGVGEGSGMLRLDLATDAPDIVRRIEQVVGRAQALLGMRVVEVTLDAAQYRLRSRQVSRRQEDEQPIVAERKAMHLAVDGDVVDAGAGPRIGRENQMIAQLDGKAIGHNAALQDAARCGAVAETAADV